MATSLVLRLLVFPLGSFVFFYSVFSLREPLPTFVFGTTEAMGAAFVAGSFTWLALNKWLVIRRMRAELAIARQMKFEDGKRAVVSGRIKAKETPLESPCTGTRCAAYRYKVVRKARSGWITDFRGYAMTPSVIRGTTKTAFILAETDDIEFLILKPHLATVDGDRIEGDAAKERLRQYLAKIDFGAEFNDRMNAGSEARTKETYVEPGHFRKDTCAKDRDSVTQDNMLLEMVIAEGETFLMSGIYCADKNGIGPGPNSTLEPLRLIKGGEAAHRAEIAGKQRTVMISLALAALVTAVHFAGIV
ncbi:MAG: hypothetical protein KDH15_20235 [Rhodocyclaceae bacterium]|nr:hypothetical protein [Rhodocyclaceae bacterium]